MPAASTQIQFAAEFLSVLVACCGLALLALPAPGRRAGARVLAPAAGFVVLGTVAFARGSLLVVGHGAVLGAGRLAGAALLALGAAWWPAGRGGRIALAAGAAVVGVAGAVGAAGGSGVAVDVLLIAGDLAVATALAAAARLSIAARIAASAAATLLLVVLVVAVALSTVITNQGEHDQLRALGSLARADGEQVATSTTSALSSAATLTGALERSFPVGARRSDLPAGSTGQRQVAALLRVLPVGPPGTVAGYLPAHGPLTGAASALLGPAPGLLLLRRVDCSGAVGVARSGLEAVSGRLLAVAAEPVCPAGVAAPYGTVVVAVPLGTSLVDRLSAGAGPGVQAAVTGGGRLLVASQTGAASLARAAALGPGTRLVGNHFVAVQPIGDGVDLVLIASMASLVRTLHSLFETLFLVALGGALLALGLAALTGDRITAGVRRLTRVAERIQAGEVSERVGPVSVDEVGTLAAAFDAMVASVEEKNVALRDAADDETRLRNRLEAVVAGMGDALVAADAGGRITAFNPAAERLLGIRADEAIGRALTAVVRIVGAGVGGGGGLPAEAPSLVAGPSTGAWSAVADVDAGGGDCVPVALTAGPLAEPAGTVLLLRDLRGEREVERMKSEFLSRIGHELRTPLTGVIGYADLLLHRDVPPADAHRWHQEILAAARRQLRTISMLEFFAFTGAGRLALELRPLDPGALVEAVAAEWCERAGSDHPVEFRAARRLPAVLGDARWLAAALDELIGNAVKFSLPGGEVIVRLGRSHLADGREAVEISVRDHGPGMSADEQRAAFGEFVQGDTSDTRRAGGLGLGLPLVQRVVEGHGGAVVCRSAPGRGSQLRILVPAAGVRSAGPTRRAASPAAS